MKSDPITPLISQMVRTIEHYFFASGFLAPGDPILLDVPSGRSGIVHVLFVDGCGVDYWDDDSREVFRAAEYPPSRRSFGNSSSASASIASQGPDDQCYLPSQISLAKRPIQQ